MKGNFWFLKSLSPNEPVQAPNERCTGTSRRGALVKGIALALILAVCTLLAVVQPAAAGAPDSKGMDFWLAFNTNLGTPTLSLFIAGETPTTGMVAIPGLGFTTTFSVTPGAVTTVSVPSAAMLSATDGVENLGIHVTSVAEVTVYGLNRIQYTTDAYLGLPTDILGTEYIVLAWGIGNGGSEFAVVGTQDGTTVTITPPMLLGSHPAGTPYTVSLNQGQVYQLISSGNDVSGTVVTSNKPLAVFGGHTCATIPNSGTYYCDHVVEEIPPTATWGKSFVTEPLATRTVSDTFRILATQDNTNVTINGASVATLNRGQFTTQQIIPQVPPTGSTITATGPVLVAQYSNGTTWDGVTSDPFMMLIPPYEQFLASYTVTTPASGFRINFINVVASSASVGNVILDGTAIPALSFTPIGFSGFSGAQVPVALGSHTLSAALPFGTFVYGFDTDDSYGYPGGLSLAPVARVTSIVLSPKTVSASLGTQACVNATISDQNNKPLAGVRVDFNVTGVNPNSGFQVTANSGVAQFCYTGTNGGIDTIIASVGTLADTATVSITVNPKTDPTITWASPAAITYGTALSAVQLNATASVPGSFVYTPAAGTVPAAGARTLSVTFTPTDTAAYNTATATVPLTVTKASATVTLGSLNQTYDGTPRAATATTTPAGLGVTFSYDDSSVVPTTAGNHTVVATVSDVNYQGSASGTLVIAKATPIITWANPAPINAGTPLSAAQLNAAASVPGTFVYTPAAGAILPVGTQTLSATFTPTDTVNYNTATATVSITVNPKITPTITWANPAAITYGTALSAVQLNATASVPGTFVYTPAAGTVPAAGARTLSVTFTPSDTAAYNTATATVPLTVTKASATVTLGSLNQTYDGTPRAATATTTPAGLSVTFSYDDSSVVPTTAGNHTVVATVSDVNYQGSTSGTLVIARATPTITWASPAPITVGTALSAVQLNATASVPGTFVYTPAAGAILPAGTQTLSTTFTPTDTANYSTATATVSITVRVVDTPKITPTITWASPAAITYGMALSATQLNATASVPGSFAYTPAAGTVLNAGARTLAVTFTPTDTAAYNSATATVPLTVTKASATVTLGSLNQTYDGTPKAATATTTPAGLSVTFTYDGTPVAPTVIGSYAVVATVSDVNYQGSASGTLVIAGATPEVVIAVKSSGDGSTDPPGPIVIVPTGGSQTITFTPVFGYHVQEIKVDGVVQPITDPRLATVTFPNALTNHTVSVSFAPPDGKVAFTNGQPDLGIGDAVVAMQIAVGNLAVSDEYLLHGDVAPLANGKPGPDGKIDIGDVVVIMRKVLGLVAW